MDYDQLLDWKAWVLTSYLYFTHIPLLKCSVNIYVNENTVEPVFRDLLRGKGGLLTQVDYREKCILRGFKDRFDCAYIYVMYYLLCIPYKKGVCTHLQPLEDRLDRCLNPWFPDHRQYILCPWDAHLNHWVIRDILLSSFRKTFVSP